jgi:uncharacterized cupredoxin-like copper-binding protein
MHRHFIGLASLAALAGALVLAGCGGNGTSSSGTTSAGTTTAASATATGPTALTVAMTEFAFTPKDATAPAGTITINAPNQGKVIHELVLIKTDLATDALPVQGTDVNEDAFPAAALPGEIPDVKPGTTGTLTVTLPAGRYVMLCNVEGHYKAGMVGTLTVQ